jgi:low affinity Fe/Cu permease
LNELFRRFAKYTSELFGSSWAFCAAVISVLMWGLAGPYFHYSDAWQLAINTGTTILTFLMVFLIQNTQNRDSRATHLKLDELIKAVRGARNSMIDLDRLTTRNCANSKRITRRFATVGLTDQRRTADRRAALAVSRLPRITAVVLRMMARGR